MKENKQEIKYFVATELEKRLPFAITTYEEIMKTDHIFTPSLRDFHVIFWIKKGVGEYFLDFKKYEFKAGTIIFLSKDQLHYFLPFKPDETEIISIGFKPEVIYRNDLGLEHLFKFNSNSYQTARQTIPVPLAEAVHFQKYFDDLMLISQSWKKEYQYKGFYHNLCLFLLKCEIVQEYQNEINGEAQNNNLADYLAFSQLLEQHYKTEFKVAFYLEEMNMSLKMLTKLTKAYYKVSPKSVIDERRILEIKRLLKGTSKSSKVIAYELQFDEPTNMFKFFKKHMGVTPKEFKNQV